MTVEEFKKDYPEHAHLEGDELWDTMTHTLYRQMEGERIILSIKPFYKRYKLRYLFYRKPIFRGFMRPEWLNEKICKNCKRGSNSCMAFMGKMICIGCGAELIEIANNRLKFRLFKLQAPIGNFLWLMLQYLHIVKTSTDGRYELFGDEANYVSHIYNIETGAMRRAHKKRKWFEYIFIKR